MLGVGNKGASLVCLLRALIPFLRPSLYQRRPYLQTPAWALGFQHKFGAVLVHSIPTVPLQFKTSSFTWSHSLSWSTWNFFWELKFQSTARLHGDLDQVQISVSDSVSLKWEHLRDLPGDINALVSGMVWYRDVTCCGVVMYLCCDPFSPLCQPSLLTSIIVAWILGKG